jgi:hypothetical protein
MVGVGSVSPWVYQRFNLGDQFFAVGNGLARSVDQIDFNFIEAEQHSGA